MLTPAFVASGSGYCTLELILWTGSYWVLDYWPLRLLRLDLVNDIGIEVVDWPTLGIGNDCFYAAAATRIVVDSWGLRKSGGCLYILYCLYFFYYYFFTHRLQQT